MKPLATGFPDTTSSTCRKLFLSSIQDHSRQLQNNNRSSCHRASITELKSVQCSTKEASFSWWLHRIARDRCPWPSRSLGHRLGTRSLRFWTTVDKWAAPNRRVFCFNGAIGNVFFCVRWSYPAIILWGVGLDPAVVFAIPPSVFHDTAPECGHRVGHTARSWEMKSSVRLRSLRIAEGGSEFGPEWDIKRRRVHLRQHFWVSKCSGNSDSLSLSPTEFVRILIQCIGG